MSACPILGFTVQMELAPGADASALWSALETLLEARGLRGDGGGDQQLDLLVSSEAGQATELDREAVIAWLHARPDVAGHGVGPLVDLERTA